MNRAVLFRLVLAITLCLSSLVCSADYTNRSTINTLLYNANADFAFFTAPGGWIVYDSSGQQSCSPTYVQITSSVPERDKLFSVALAAYMAGKEVEFVGDCSTQQGYFNTTYIRVF